MQHNKNTKKVEQIEKISQSEDDITHSIISVMNKFNIKSVLKPFDILKRSGALVSTITMTLIILPFITKGSVWDLFSNDLNKDDEGEKDSFYELKNNSKINWRTLLYGIANRFHILLSSSYDETTKQIRAIILDDTTVAKTGKHIESTGYVHDHVSGRFVLGFKILVSGYWDGVSFIPIDFSIHREKRDGGLKKAQNRIEKKKDQIKHTQEHKKEVVIRIDKIKKQIKQLKTPTETRPSKTLQKQLSAKALSLKNNQNRLAGIEQKTEEQKQKLHFLENAYYELQKQSGKCGLKAEDYSKQFKKQRQRDTNGYKRKKEVDAQIADTTISFIRYILLSYYERTHYGTSIGGLFQKLSQASVKENLVADLSHVFMELLQAFAQLAGIDFMTLYEELIRQPQCQKLINKLKLFPNTLVA